MKHNSPKQKTSKQIAQLICISRIPHLKFTFCHTQYWATFVQFKFLFNATGDHWPHSFGSVRLPVTGSGRWQPNQSFPSVHINLKTPLSMRYKWRGFYYNPHQNPPKSVVPALADLSCTQK